MTAHDLALGLLTAWLPTLILTCIVDRNPAATGPVMTKLNKFLATTRTVLLERDDRLRERGVFAPALAWTQNLRENSEEWDDFFTTFAGQGRVRWHYGVCQPIIVGIEEAFSLDDGREWLEGANARQRLVDGPTDHGVPSLRGLHYFDLKELWQLLSANLVVLTAVAGAFLISFFTPTVGLGCRSGGYLIFYIIAFSLFLIEYLAWWFLPDKSAVLGDQFPNYRQPASRGRFSTRQMLEYFVLRPLECFNTIWLSYIITAQTFGSYQTCSCMGSIWAGRGGYIDFSSYNYYDNPSINQIWAGAVVISIIPMFIAFIYIVWEWCEQSHMCTTDYGKARRGLFRTRWIKLHTLWLRVGPAMLTGIIKRWHRNRSGGYDGAGKGHERRRSSLIWTRKPRQHSYEIGGGWHKGNSRSGDYEHLKNNSHSGEEVDIDAFRAKATAPPTVAIHEVQRGISPLRTDRAILLHHQQEQPRRSHSGERGAAEGREERGDSLGGGGGGGVYSMQTFGSPDPMATSYFGRGSEQDPTARQSRPFYSPG